MRANAETCKTDMLPGLLPSRDRAQAPVLEVRAVTAEGKKCDRTDDLSLFYKWE